jgi:hypothetical protein
MEEARAQKIVRTAKGKREKSERETAADPHTTFEHTRHNAPTEKTNTRGQLEYENKKYCTFLLFVNVHLQPKKRGVTAALRLFPSQSLPISLRIR